MAWKHVLQFLESSGNCISLLIFRPVVLGSSDLTAQGAHGSMFFYTGFLLQCSFLVCVTISAQNLSHASVEIHTAWKCFGWDKSTTLGNICCSLWKLVLAVSSMAFGALIYVFIYDTFVFQLLRWLVPAILLVVLEFHEDWAYCFQSIYNTTDSTDRTFSTVSGRYTDIVPQPFSVLRC